MVALTNCVDFATHAAGTTQRGTATPNTRMRSASQMGKCNECGRTDNFGNTRTPGLCRWRIPQWNLRSWGYLCDDLLPVCSNNEKRTDRARPRAMPLFDTAKGRGGGRYNVVFVYRQRSDESSTSSAAIANDWPAQLASLAALWRKESGQIRPQFAWRKPGFLRNCRQELSAYSSRPGFPSPHRNRSGADVASKVSLSDVVLLAPSFQRMLHNPLLYQCGCPSQVCDFPFWGIGIYPPGNP